MIDEGCEVTTRCPHCASPLVWAARDVGDVPVMVDWSCDCALSDAAWSAVGDEVSAALAERVDWAA